MQLWSNRAFLGKEEGDTCVGCCVALGAFYLTEESQDETRDATEDTSGHKVSRLITFIINLPPKGSRSDFNLSDSHL